MAPRVETLRPRPWVRQTDTGAPTRSKDCGPRLVINGILWSSGNRVGPTTTSKARQTSWTALVRRMMGRPGTVATSVDHWAKALKSPALRDLFAAKGLEPPNVKSLEGASWRDDVPDHLAAGRMVLAAVDYGTLADDPLDPPVGSRTFRDGHAVGFAGYTLEDGLVYTVAMDSLLMAPRVVRLRAYRDAAGDFGTHPWGRGKLEGISIARAKPIVRPQEPPEEPSSGTVTTEELMAILGPLELAEDRLRELIDRVGG